jgi:hypothetical protein
LSLLAPLLLEILHQRELDGTSVRQMDLDRSLEDRAAAFVRAYSADTAVAEAVAAQGQQTRRERDEIYSRNPCRNGSASSIRNTCSPVM